MAGRLLISSQTRRSPQGEVGSGNGTLLHRTAAGFTFTGIPEDFAVLCQLIAPCRRCPHRYAGGLSPLRSGSLRFLSIRSRFSHSVACIASLASRLRCATAPSRGRPPFRAWPLVVVSSFSCVLRSTLAKKFPCNVACGMISPCRQFCASDLSVFTSTPTREVSLPISMSGHQTEAANSGWSLPFFSQATGA